MVVPKAVKRNNVVFFEHLFLGEEGLGLVYDPSVRSGQKKGVGVSWLNIGDQQVHINQEENISRTPGPVRLLMPDFDDFAKTTAAEKSSNSTGNNRRSFEGLLLPCHIGTAKAIAQFYRTLLEAEATEHTDADGQVNVHVELGYGMTFTFQEDAGLGPLHTQKAIEAYESWHCALYILATKAPTTG
ncbi:hypothetical protein WJX77_001490 [Trebouxia sp. C0004]